MSSPRRRDPHLLKILKWELDECALDGNTQLLHLHHILFRSHGGDDVRANIVCLCLSCHESVHRGDSQALLAQHILNERPDTILYLEEKLGKEAAKEWFAIRSIG